MSLGTILTKMASVGALQLNNDDQLNLAISQVNDAAEELLRENDLIGGLVEQVFNIDPTVGNQVTLPWYVGVVRGVRYYSPAMRMNAIDMRPRYASRFWQSETMLDFRIKQDTCLLREITNTGSLTITLRAALSVPVTISIAGQTLNAAEEVESLTIPIGSLSITTVNSFLDIKSISKNITTDCDVDIYDMDGLLLSTIANDQLTAKYVLAQIYDSPNNLNGGTSIMQPFTQYIELLYKPRFLRLVAPADEFQCQGYDTAIFWKWMEHRALYKVPPDAQSALVYKAQGDKICADVAKEHDLNIKKSLNFGTNAYLEVQARLRAQRSFSSRGDMGYGYSGGYAGNSTV